MSLLTRYLVRDNLFLLLTILLVGTGLYLLTDLFDRLDQFLDADLGVWVIFWYFLVKSPMIISQILPAVFLISIIVQFSLMAKSRETMALQAGGISPLVFIRFVLLYGAIWAMVQLGFSQALGVQGEQLAGKIWKEQIRGKEREQVVLQGLWFTDGDYVVHLGKAFPEEKKGADLLAYRLSDNGAELQQIIRAGSFAIINDEWVLQNVSVASPASFSYERKDSFVLPIEQDLSAFLAVDPGTNPSHLPVWQLGEAIDHLARSGSNVEVLRTAFHAKFAYAASLVVMGVLGLAIVLWRDNIYIAIGLGLLVTFLFFASSTLCNALGSKGFISPFVAGWAANIFFLSLAVIAIIIKVKPKLSR